jgi:transposase-like protein
MSTATAVTIDYALAEQEIGTAWQNCQRPNLEFGEVLYKWREQFSAQGSRTGRGLAQILRKLEINEGAAYYWIYRYEVSTGERAPKEKKKPSSDALTEVRGDAPEQGTVSSTKPDPSPWTKGIKEKRQNRTKPIETEAAVLTLARRIIDAGYKVLVDAGENKSHLQAAKTLAKTKLDLAI